MGGGGGLFFGVVAGVRVLGGPFGFITGVFVFKRKKGGYRIIDGCTVVLGWVSIYQRLMVINGGWHEIGDQPLAASRVLVCPFA